MLWQVNILNNASIKTIRQRLAHAALHDPTTVSRPFYGVRYSNVVVDVSDLNLSLFDITYICQMLRATYTVKTNGSIMINKQYQVPTMYTVSEVQSWVH